MSTDLVPAAPVVTADQLDLVKRTVATGATDAELKLYLYDCARQGVHPLDRLLHFTKRGGKYVPVTSIDLMRIRAADTGEYAGSDDAILDDDEQPSRAKVTVWRLVQGQRCAFTATARWSEYKPEQNDFQWKKMPCTMLAKCAEALALRKGFPRQLTGLYAKEEMDQAGLDRVEVVDTTTGEVKPVKAPQNSTAPNAQTPPPSNGDTISEAQKKRLFAIARSHHWKDAELKEWLLDLWNYDSTAAIKREHYDAICEQLGMDDDRRKEHHG